jgi:hypothetical protein
VRIVRAPIGVALSEAERPHSATPTASLLGLALLLSACPGTLTDPALIQSVRAASVCNAPTQVFAARCSGCHSPGPGEYAGLDLTSPGVDKRTSGVVATCKGEVLVVPGVPDASYLLSKLTETSPACGSQMPLNGMLGTDDLDCVESWIAGLGSSGPPPDLSCGDNLDPAHAAPLASGATPGCIATNGAEAHFYALSTPGDAGGTFFISLDDAGAGTLEEQVLFPNDDGGTEIVHVSAYQPGGSLSLFFAAAPGETYWVSVFQVVTTSAPFGYTLHQSFAPIDDPSAGHSAPQDPLPIDVGTPQSGSFFAGYTSAAPPAPSDLGSWFLVELPAGPATVALTGCPSDIRAQLVLTDSTGSTTLASQTASGDGLEVDLDAGITTAGSYLIHAVPFDPPLDPPSGAGSSPPPYFNQSYSVVVGQ